jgi:hypothetical protein
MEGVEDGWEASFGDCLEGEMLVNSEDWRIIQHEGNI